MYTHSQITINAISVEVGCNIEFKHV